MKLSCTYKSIEWRDNLTVYTCSIENAEITDPEALITEIEGKHEVEKSDAEVLGVEFVSSVVHYLPKNFSKYFPNIICLEIDECGLKRISREDFKGIEQLQQLFLSSNDLEYLPSNLFEGLLDLKAVSFEKNKDLHSISPSLLIPIKDRINYIDFRKTKALDLMFQNGHKKSVASIDAVIEEISEKCTPPWKLGIF